MEEWIVPVIVIERKQDVEDHKEYHLRVKTPFVRPDSFTKMVAVTLEIIPCPKDGCVLSVRIHGKAVNCTVKNGSCTFRYKPVNGETQVQAEITFNDFAYQVQFSVIYGIAKNSNFQI